MMQELLSLKQATFAWSDRAVGEGRVDHILRLLVAAVVVLFPAACLLVDRSDTLSLLLLLLIGLSVWVRNGFKARFTHRDWLFLSGFLLFFLAAIVSFQFGLQTDIGFRLLGRHLRLIAVLPALMALKRYRPPTLLAWAGAGLGALVLGLDAIHESVASNGFLRPDGDTNVAILFGDLATLTTFVFAAGYVHIDARLPRLGPWTVALCVLAGLMACFLSGTRGAWLALPILLILFLSCRHLLHPKTVFMSALAIAALFAALYAVPQSHVQERLQDAGSQWVAYRDSNRSLEDSRPPPVCMDEPELLQAWATQGKQGTPGALKLEAKPQNSWLQANLKQLGCTHFGALQIINDGDQAASVWMPRSAQPVPGPATTRWLAAGNMVLQFGTDTRFQHIVNQPDFMTVDMTAPRRDADGVTVTLSPHQTAMVVPVETTTGEYRYALVHTPIGQRLEMWAAAWKMFLQSPLTGMGTGAYMTEAQKLVDAGSAPAVAAIYDHPHSDYMDALSSRGLLGLLSLLALLGLPAWLFGRAVNSPDPKRMGAGLAGLLVSVGFALFALTETMFVHSVTIGWYVIMTAVFMALSEEPEGRGSVTE